MMLTIDKQTICDFLSQAGIEGFESEPYLDSAGISTIGCGTTVYPNGRRVTLKDVPISRDTALDYLWSYVQKDIIGLNRLIIPTLNINQSTAIISFSYNTGLTNFSGSTLLRLINNGTDDSEVISNAFKMWNKVTVNGKKVVSNGLVNRRDAEISLFFS
jgi:lysozyme